MYVSLLLDVVLWVIHRYTWMRPQYFYIFDTVSEAFASELPENLEINVFSVLNA